MSQPTQLSSSYSRAHFCVKCACVHMDLTLTSWVPHSLLPHPPANSTGSGLCSDQCQAVCVAWPAPHSVSGASEGPSLYPVYYKASQWHNREKKKLQTELFVCFPFWTWTWNVLSIKNDSFSSLMSITLSGCTLYTCVMHNLDKKATQRAFINTCFFQGLIPFSGQPLDTLVVQKMKSMLALFVRVLCPHTHIFQKLFINKPCEKPFIPDRNSTWQQWIPSSAGIQVTCTYSTHHIKRRETDSELV